MACDELTAGFEGGLRPVEERSGDVIAAIECHRDVLGIVCVGDPVVAFRGFLVRHWLSDRVARATVISLRAVDLLSRN